MLLSSPSFSGFLDTLAANPAAVQSSQAPAAVPQPQPQSQSQLQERQVRKDINPYTAQQQMQQQQIGMAMIPEYTMDFSVLDFTTDGAFSYQPQVFSVLSLPETVIDSEILSGKTSPFSPSLASEGEKVELPVVERMPVSEPEAVTAWTEAEEVDEEFDADPAFALFTSSATSPPAPESPELDLSVIPLFNGIQPEKAFARFELVVEESTVDDAIANAAMAKVMRLCESLDVVAEKLSALTLDL